MSKRIAAYLILIGVCIGSAALVLPTINENINDPNMIAYFSHDEGYLMDLVWYHYSGVKRPSFQYDGDYGLEMPYLADIARLFSRFMTFTPGTFVLILRWLHLFMWIIALLMLWRFVNYHFGKLWLASLSVALFASYPAFAYIFLCPLKPDPPLLVLMILGLDHTLRIFDGHPRRHLVLAVAAASAASLLKFFMGLFLLPPIVVAVYLVSRYKKGAPLALKAFDFAWTFPGIIGVASMSMALATIFVYKRRISGLTWFQEHGFVQSLILNKAVLSIIIFGIILIVISILVLCCNKARQGWVRRLANFANEINSQCLMVFALFVLFSAIFGFRWIMHPDQFLDLYSQMGREAFGYSTNISSGGSVWVSVFTNLVGKIKEFNPVILSLLIIYPIAEYMNRRETIRANPALLFKRITLAGFIAPFLPYLSSGGRSTHHIMLPFVIAAAILGIQGVVILSKLCVKRIWPRRALLAVIAMPILMTIGYNTKTTVSSFIYRYHKEEDVVFDIIKWWRGTYPTDTSIVADHPTAVYLPQEYKNARFLKFQYEKIGQLRDLVGTFRPRLVYLEMGPDGNFKGRSIEDILPKIRVKEAASFSNVDRPYKRMPDARYVIYEISY